MLIGAIEPIVIAQPSDLKPDHPRSLYGFTRMRHCRGYFILRTK